MLILGTHSIFSYLEKMKIHFIFYFIYKIHYEYYKNGKFYTEKEKTNKNENVSEFPIILR